MLHMQNGDAAVSFCQISVSEVLAVVAREAYCELLAIDNGLEVYKVGESRFIIFEGCVADDFFRGMCQNDRLHPHAAHAKWGRCRFILSDISLRGAGRRRA